MAEVGLFLSSEEHGPNRLVETACKGAEAGFRSVFISDHFHPWLENQGQSPFVWSVIGGIAAKTKLKVTTGVTCPIMRIHPAVLAQAAATSALMLEGRFAFGVGSGEALNEHILGLHWPEADVRLEMLAEAIEVMRRLWDGGQVSHYGSHFKVENARIYSLPRQPPPVLISGFGPKSLALAARLGEGFVTTSPADQAVEDYRHQGGKGPIVGAVKVCWAADEAAAKKSAHELWRSSGVPGQLSQELRTPAHFEQASENVTVEAIAEKIPCGPDPERHAAAIKKYLEAGFDEVYVTQIGDDQEGFLSFYFEEVEPRLGL